MVFWFSATFLTIRSACRSSWPYQKIKFSTRKCFFYIRSFRHSKISSEFQKNYALLNPLAVRLTYKKPWKCVYWGNSDENRGSIDFYTQETAFCTPFHANSTLSEISAEYHILMQCRQIMSCKCSTSFSLFIWKSHHWKNAEKV